MGNCASAASAEAPGTPAERGEEIPLVSLRHGSASVPPGEARLRSVHVQTEPQPPAPPPRPGLGNLGAASGPAPTMGHDSRSRTSHGQHSLRGEARCPFGGPGHDSGLSMAGRELVGETATICRSASRQPHHQQRWTPLEEAYQMDPDRPDPRLSSLPEETLVLLRPPTLAEVSLPQLRSPLPGGTSPRPLRPAPLAGGSPRTLRPHSPDGRAARPWKDRNRSGPLFRQPRLEGEVLGRFGKTRLEGEDRRRFARPGTESDESMEDREPVGERATSRRWRDSQDHLPRGWRTESGESMEDRELVEERATSRRWRDSQDHLPRGLPPRPLPAQTQATLETSPKMPCSDPGHHTSGYVNLNHHTSSYVNVNPAPPSSSLVCRPIPPPTFSRQRLK